MSKRFWLYLSQRISRGLILLPMLLLWGNSWGQVDEFSFDLDGDHPVEREAETFTESPWSLALILDGFWVRSEVQTSASLQLQRKFIAWGMGANVGFLPQTGEFRGGLEGFWGEDHQVWLQPGVLVQPNDDMRSSWYVLFGYRNITRLSPSLAYFFSGGVGIQQGNGFINLSEEKGFLIPRDDYFFFALNLGVRFNLGSAAKKVK